MFFTFRHHLFGSLLGNAALIGMIIFLLVKLVFLAFDLIGKIKFSADGNNVERDESGRPIRETEEEVYFTGENDSETLTPTVEDEVYFFNKDENENNTPEADNDFFFG